MKQFLLPKGSLENANELTQQTKGCLHHTAILLRLRPQESADIFETAYFFGHETAFRPHETSEFGHPISIVLKSNSRVV